MEAVRVLIVDDDPSFLELMTLHLRKRGFRVECGQDGLEALQIIRSHGPFDVIVTDLMMPGLSGLELLRRARKLDPWVEVIVITAAGSLEMAISALREDGAYDYLTKPLEMMGELSLAVERAANHRHLRLEREAMRGSLVNGARRLEEILSSTGYAILAANERDEFIAVSPAARKLFGNDAPDLKAMKKCTPEIIKQIIHRWKSLNGQAVAWVDVAWPEGLTHLVRLAPMQVGDSMGWVMVLQDITYQKRLETFIVNKYALVTSKIRQPMEKASVVIADLEDHLRSGTGDASEHFEQLKHLFETARAGSEDLLALRGNGSQNFDGSEIHDEVESVSLVEFLEKMKGQMGDSIQYGRRVQIRWNLTNDLPPIHLVRMSLAQIFLHLLQHAVMRSNEGDEIEISSWSDENLVWMEMKDVGQDRDWGDEIQGLQPPGTSKNEILNRPQIELAVVKSLVDQSAGQVWTRRRDQRGLAITVCFVQ
jgi:CheY-like chemotaxis protein